MTARRAILLVGLTGGIASGKSTVDAMFQELGAHVIDADRLVHALLGPGGKAVAPVIDAFGTKILHEDGGVDRASLGRIVFSDTAARARLERIVHPMVTAAILERIDAIRSAAGGPLVIVDATLLVETGADRNFDRLVAVTCSEEAQIERLASSRSLSREEALLRIRAQATPRERALRADYTIDNGGPLARTREEARRVYAALVRDYENEMAAGLLSEGPITWS